MFDEKLFNEKIQTKLEECMNKIDIESWMKAFKSLFTKYGVPNDIAADFILPKITVEIKEDLVFMLLAAPIESLSYVLSVRAIEGVYGRVYDKHKKELEIAKKGIEVPLY